VGLIANGDKPARRGFLGHFTFQEGFGRFVIAALQITEISFIVGPHFTVNRKDAYIENRARDRVLRRKLMLLTSTLFKDNQKLQDCAQFDRAHLVADEPPLRRAENAQGPHVALVHRALRKVMPNVSFGLEEATETYGPKTAEVVRQFKASQKPPILNQKLRQTVPDNIVGIQTIQALDKAVGKIDDRVIPDLPVPPIDPTPVPESVTRRIVFRRFQKVETSNPQADPRAGDAKEQSDALISVLTGQLAPEAALAPFESLSSRQVASVPAAHRVNDVATVVETDIAIQFQGTISTVTTTTITYVWGEQRPFVTVAQTQKIKVFDDQRPPVTTNAFVPRAAAEKMPFVVPPNP
jgi:hypothetical protein